MTAAEKRTYRLAEKTLAGEIAEKAQRLVDARGHAEVYMARILLAQAMNRMVDLARAES